MADSPDPLPLGENSLKRKTREANKSWSLPSKKKKTPAKSKKAKADNRQGPKRPNDWQCSYCCMVVSLNESPLIMCDGPCPRSFHEECIKPFDVDLEGSVWYCSDCEEGIQECFICKEKGHDCIVSVY
jgi:hypothetical protein